MCSKNEVSRGATQHNHHARELRRRGILIFRGVVVGCREACVDGKTGLLVPARSIEPLADALERLTLDATLRNRLGGNARRQAEEVFAENIINARTLALYEKMLSR